MTRRSLSLLALLLLASACAATKPEPMGPRIFRGKRLDPAELFPADLDLVVRVDIGRMRSALGPSASALASRAEAEMDEPIVARALSQANVVWIGLRLADLDAGDRVLVVEGDDFDLDPDLGIFRPGEPPADGVRSFDRRGRLRRPSTARILAFEKRAIAFVSPAEVDSIDRLFRRGADAWRRDPPAEGIVSADLRPRRLPASLERRYPSIGAIIRGVERARASATMEGEDLRVDAEILGISAAAAERAEEFFLALREGGLETRYAALFAALKVERVERAVHVRFSIPPDLLRVLAEGEAAKAVQARP